MDFKNLLDKAADGLNDLKEKAEDFLETPEVKGFVEDAKDFVEDAKEIQGMLDELDYVLDNCTLMEKKQETDIELEEEMEDIEK